MDISITPHKLKRALNSNLPDDIHVINTYEVAENFHARYNVKSKIYEYHINLGEYIPMERNYVFQYNYHLNISKMREALKLFVGEHDFRAFVTDNKEKENCVRTIYSAEIIEDGDHCIIRFHGNGFLRYQVRNMVGILIRVGEEKVSCEEVEKILLSRDRSKYGKTAPSQGLYLVKVNYN